MSIKYNIASDGETAEKHCFAQSVKIYAQYRGNLLNIQDMKEYDVSLLADVDLTSDKFPLFYRNKATGKVNSTSGYTTKLGLRETADGKFCYIQEDDYSFESVIGEDENGEPITTTINVEYSKIPLGFAWDDITETEPEWKVIEDEG